MHNGRLIVFLSVFSILLMAGCSPTTSEKGQPVIKIAFVSPLTGDVAAMGQGMKHGAQMAIEDANKLYPPYKFVLLALDDRADPKEAVNAANQIISDRRVYGVVGHLNSGCSIPASMVYQKRNLAMISPASTNPKLTKQGLSNVFRLCATDEVQGQFCAEYLHRNQIHKIAVIHDKTPYGQGLAEELVKTVKARKGKIVCYEAVNLGDKDFKSLLIKIKSLHPQAIYFGGMYQEGGLISKQARELALNIPVIGGDGIYSSEYIKIAGNASEGDLATCIGLPPEKLPRAQAFINRYKQRFPGFDMQPYDAMTYDTTMLLAQAIVKAGLDRGAVVNELHRTLYDGLTGKVQFDADGDTLNKAISLYTVKNGTWVYKE